jgi:transcriptional regulator with XRE-family HTH domain
MDRIESINRDRIRWCAADRGISLDDLPAEAGVPEKAFAKLMEDGTGLTFPQLRKLADYFGRGALFFLDQGPVDENRVHSVQYRTLTNQKPEISNSVRKLIERAERQRELYLALREELHADDYPIFRPINVRADHPAAAAAAVRAWLNLERTNTFDAFRAAVEAKGILVFRSNGYAGRWQISKDSPILGFSLYSDVCPVIFVKKSRWETQQTFIGPVRSMMTMICIRATATSETRTHSLGIYWYLMRGWPWSEMMIVRTQCSSSTLGSRLTANGGV